MSRKIDKIEIKGLLYVKKITPADIAKKFKCSRSNISQVLSGKSKSKQITDFISKQIGREHKEIFGY